jgi:hypothetical protein
MTGRALKENLDQRALRLWITAGLRIPEVVRLHGDAGYLLNNMIAKYTLAADGYAISTGALEEFERRGVDLTAVHTRRIFYGKKSGFIYEHAVPAGVVREALLAAPATDEAVTRCLLAAGQVAVLLRAEDARLREVGLASKMPSGWSLGDDPLARYEVADIVLSSQILKLKGAICR